MTEIISIHSTHIYNILLIYCINSFSYIVLYKIEDILMTITNN